ncbi:MAG TPA: PadR family transcriptional regulator [Burkholderiales bacterium]|jgi:DNA-binding PadR family transcriptional regulator|nr:PadR family transcriptional regulator [Burkholderiales bacterium]
MKISTLGHALLGLLAANDLTGYELTQTFDISLAHVWSASHSQIYPELAKLQAAGLIHHTESGPRGSKRYTATVEGREEVRRWLNRPPQPQAVRSERLLRVFFLWMLPPDDARAYLRAEAVRHRAQLAEYDAIAEQIPPDAGAAMQWSRISLEAGIRYERAMAEWADWAAHAVPSAAEPP